MFLTLLTDTTSPKNLVPSTVLLILGGIFLAVAVVMYIIFIIKKKGCKTSKELIEKFKIKTQKNPDAVVDLMNIVMLAIGVIGLLLVLIAVVIA